MSAPRKPRRDPIRRWIEKLLCEIDKSEIRIQDLQRQIESHRELIFLLENPNRRAELRNSDPATLFDSSSNSGSSI